MIWALCAPPWREALIWARNSLSKLMLLRCVWCQNDGIWWIHHENGKIRGFHVNSTKSWISRDRGSRTPILDNELLGFSQSGGLWRSRLGFFTPTHVPRGFIEISRIPMFRVVFCDFHVIFPRGRREVENGYAGTLVKHKSGHNFNEGKLAAARIFRF